MGFDVMEQKRKKGSAQSRRENHRRSEPQIGWIEPMPSSLHSELIPTGTVDEYNVNFTLKTNNGLQIIELGEMVLTVGGAPQPCPVDCTDLQPELPLPNYVCALTGTFDAKLLRVSGKLIVRISSCDLSPTWYLGELDIQPPALRPPAH